MNVELFFNNETWENTVENDIKKNAGRAAPLPGRHHVYVVVVAEEYPEREHHLLIEQREGAVPESILEIMSDMEEEKQRLAREGKDRASALSFSEERMPLLVIELRMNPSAWKRSDLWKCAWIVTLLQTHNLMMHTKLQLPVSVGCRYRQAPATDRSGVRISFVIPRMVSGADFWNAEEPRRRRKPDDAPGVSVRRFVAGFAR